MSRLPAILSDIVAERLRQDAKWGPATERGYADGTGGATWRDGRPAHSPQLAEIRRQKARDIQRLCDAAAAAGRPQWRLVVQEEFAEAVAEEDLELLRGELIQAGAAICAWIEDIDARRGLVGVPSEHPELRAAMALGAALEAARRGERS